VTPELMVERHRDRLRKLADRYRLTAFDNRGAGRTAMPGGSVSLEMMADDAAQVLRAYLDALLDHDTTDRLPAITAPTLVLAGGRDSTARPELCRAVAELIPGARFEVMEQEAHQPFQEVPDG
jgi:pimeloyl-ACP methyl ester carboxylesterase